MPEKQPTPRQQREDSVCDGSLSNMVGKTKRGGPGLFTPLVPLGGPWSPATSAGHYLHLRHGESRDQATWASFSMLPFSTRVPDLWRERDWPLVQIRLPICARSRLSQPSLRPGVKRTTWACALTGNPARDLPVHGTTPSQPSHVGQGPSLKFQSPLLAWLLFYLQTCSIFSTPILISHLFISLYCQAVPFKSRSLPSTPLELAVSSSLPTLNSIGLFSVLTLFDLTSIWHCGPGIPCWNSLL